MTSGYRPKNAGQQTKAGGINNRCQEAELTKKSKIKIKFLFQTPVRYTRYTYITLERLKY